MAVVISTTTPTTSTTSSASTTSSTSTSTSTTSTMISWPTTSPSTSTSTTTTSTTTTTTTTTTSSSWIIVEPSSTTTTTTTSRRIIPNPTTTTLSSAIPGPTSSHITRPITSSTLFSTSPTSASISGPLSTPVETVPSSGFPKAAIAGIAVAGIIVIGFIATVLVIKHHQHAKLHKALEDDDLFDHLPIDPSPPPMTKLQSPGFHQSNNQASNFQYEGDMHDSSNYQHELEPMYQNGGEYDNHMHQMDHHGDMHQDYNQNYDGNYDNDGNFHHDPSSNMQQDHHSHFDQGHNQGFQNDGQGFQGDSQGFQGDSQGFQGDSQGFQGGDNGQGFHGDNGQGIYSDGQGFDGNGQGFDQGGNGQGFGSQGGSGQGFQGGDGSFGHTQPTTTPGNTGIHNIGGAFPLVPPPLLNKPKMRPESSNQYSILTPASPTNTTFSGEGGLVDETAIPAQGSMTISPLPLDYRTSITSSHDSWDDQSQAYGYSPQSKQALLNQTKFYEAATQHNSGRVLPSPSPKVATIALAQPAGVRAPQDAGQADIVGAMVSSGNVSSLNTFDRRHPQLSGGDGRDGVFYVSSESSRNPQDNH